MKHFLDRVKKLSFLSLPLCFFSLVLLDFSFRFFYQFAGDTELFALKPTLFTLGWALLLTALISLLPRLGKRIAMMALILLFSVLTLVHGVLFHLTGSMFSFSDLNFAGDGAKFFSWTYLNLRKAFLLCLFAAVLLMAFAAFLAPKGKPDVTWWKKLLPSLGAAALSLILLFCTHNASMPRADKMWWGNTYDPEASTVGYRYSEFTDFNQCLTMTGLYQYTFRNFLVSFGLSGNQLSAEKLDAFYEQRGLEISGENEMTGVLKGKNLIMVMMESIDTWLLTPEYMPNLYRLQQDSVDFTNFYTPTYLSAATFTTEIISQTGLLPAVSGLSSSAYSKNSFPLSLANQFEAAGYTSNSFHSASPSIYSRGSVHQNLGFETYYYSTLMGMDDYQLDSQMIRAYDKIAPEGSFFSYIITYSGHGPYTEEMKNISDPHIQKAREAVARSGVTDSPENLEEYTIAVAHAMETDAFVGALISALEEDGKLKETALLFYADHYGKYMTDKEFLLRLKGAPDDDVSIYRTPCFLYGGGLSPQRVEKYASSIDLVPTLVNLYDLPADRRYYVGDDIFGDMGGVIPLPNYAWYDGELLYPEGCRGSVTPEITDRTSAVKERMTASMDTLKCDYFKDWEQAEHQLQKGS